MKDSFGFKAELVTIGRDVYNMMGYGNEAFYATIKITLPNGKDIVETACYNSYCKPFWIPSQRHRHPNDLVKIIKDIWGSEDIGTHYHDIISDTVQNNETQF